MGNQKNVIYQLRTSLLFPLQILNDITRQIKKLCVDEILTYVMISHLIDKIFDNRINIKGGTKKMSRFSFFNFSGLEKAKFLNDTFLKCILKELSKTVFKSFLRQFSREI